MRKPHRQPGIESDAEARFADYHIGVSPEPEVDLEPDISRR